MSGKEKWEECVGKTKEEAAAIIEKDKPGVVIQFLMPMSPATADYREDRVRIIHDKDGKVVSAPVIG